MEWKSVKEHKAPEGKRLLLTDGREISSGTLKNGRFSVDITYLVGCKITHFCVPDEIPEERSVYEDVRVSYLEKSVCDIDSILRTMRIHQDAVDKEIGKIKFAIELQHPPGYCECKLCRMQRSND